MSHIRFSYKFSLHRLRAQRFGFCGVGKRGIAPRGRCGIACDMSAGGVPQRLIAISKR